jgi:hypothetical protein
MSNRFLVVWDQLGLESVWDLGAAEQQATFDALSGTPGAWNRNIGQRVQYFLLRAKANPQRHYEIYVVETSEEITSDDLENQFEQNPQGMADLVRERGTEVFSNRERREKIKIR